MSFPVSITDIPSEIGASREHHVTIAAPSDFGVPLFGVPKDDPITAELTFQIMEDGVFVHGHVAAHATGQCSRCLLDLEDDLDESISEMVFFPQRRDELIAQGDEEAGDLPVVSDDEIDIEPLVRDALILAMPLRPLCQPDCAGLCPVCGERLDDLPADHHHDEIRRESSVLDELEAQLLAQRGAGEEGTDA